MKDTLIRLLTAYGATGREDTVRQVIREMVAPYVDEMKVDALGNLITIKHGKGGKGSCWPHTWIISVSW